MRPKEFSILAGIHPSQVSRLAKNCRILRNPRTSEIITDHALTKGYLLSRFSILRAEMQGLTRPSPGWFLACAIIDQRKRAIVAWPDIPDGGQFAQWFREAEIDNKKRTVTIENVVFPLTIERGE